MIKKFNQFNEELKPSVYKKAADRLRMFGGIHTKRADALEDWSKSEEKRMEIERKKETIERVKHIGEFNMNFDIVEHTRQWTDNNKRPQIIKSFQIAPCGRVSQNSKVLTPAPNKAYLIYIDFIDPRESFSKEEFPEITSIEFLIGGIPSDDRVVKNDSFFRIHVPITWTSDDEFIIHSSECSIDSGWNDYDVTYKFADRQSAVKFKREFLRRENIENIMSKGVKENMRNFFMEYSTGEEMEKLFTKLQSISINRIYS